MIPNNAIRLNKYISESGICSRREADKYIEMGQVLINGRKAKVGDQVNSRDRVHVNGILVQRKREEDLIFLAFNKPVGVTSTTEIGIRNNIIDFIGYHERIFPIGRLDKDSQGLIFLTNNGDIVNKILRAGNNHEKEYLVTVDKPITDAFIERMASGVPILGGITKRCKVTKESPFVFRITLVQGLNRQIRRMCEFFELNVVKLERIRIMNIQLKGIPIGEWRELTENEISDIFSEIKDSSSTQEASINRGVKPKTSAKPNKQASPAKVKKGPLPKDDRSMHPKAKELRGKAKPAGPKKEDFSKGGKRPSVTTGGRKGGKTSKR